MSCFLVRKISMGSRLIGHPRANWFAGSSLSYFKKYFSHFLIDSFFFSVKLKRKKKLMNFSLIFRLFNAVLKFLANFSSLKINLFLTIFRLLINNERRLSIVFFFFLWKNLFSKWSEISRQVRLTRVNVAVTWEKTNRGFITFRWEFGVKFLIINNSLIRWLIILSC